MENGKAADLPEWSRGVSIADFEGRIAAII
jgi:hypothetical protein